MVEVTLLLDVIRTAGILVGIGYYILTLRNQQRSQKTAEETRKIQLLIDNTQHLSGEGRNDWHYLLGMQWDNYEDFISKYSAVKDPDLFERRIRAFRRLNLSGMLIKDGLVDLEAYIQYIGDVAPIMWHKFKDIILEQRRIWGSPDYLIGFEYLSNETEKYRASKGLTPLDTDVYTKSIGVNT